MKFAQWTDAEDRILGDLYPDYSRLLSALPSHNLSSIKHRCERLGIRTKKHVWTNREVALLHDHFADAPYKELEVMIGQRLPIIRRKANSLGLVRISPFMPTGSKLADSLLLRCRSQGVNMVTLDNLADTGRYFQNLRWRIGITGKDRAWFNLSNIIRGIEAVGGTLYADWNVE